MARQANRSGRSSAPKRKTSVRKKKKQTTDRTVLVGGLLVALLLGLIAVGIYFIKSDKDKLVNQPPQPKKETVVKKTGVTAKIIHQSVVRGL